MKKYLTFINCLLSFGIANGSTSLILYPGNDDPVTSKKVSLVFDPAKARIIDIEKIIGRKLKLKEKIAFKILQPKIKKAATSEDKKPKADKGKTALTFGIIALASLFIPYLGAFSFIVFTTLALVFGYQAKKENPKNKKAKTAIILGWIGLGLFAGILAIVASMYSL